ncbi:melanoma antigen preferentially expressed in tumors-like isoform X2 [Echinops telfairi]|uniref:Melanoma antigen preferentially expressed in tumors-like isoform X2 n=1 Tax=Echinops telfairi TaxID=9371 RepID=A0AC55D4F4_ECHTE|nr:melanoma antigen preferentially expressed in tumors-like isoform X2 [Echinops telfairi]
MSSASPPRLLDIAIQSVLQDEASAIDALEWLPVDLFRPLFTAAFQGGHRETVKAMVFSWPFTYLRLGVLMEDCESLYDMLKAAVDGLEMLLALKDRPKRCKLKQLDLRLNSGTEIWNTWLATQSDGSLTSSEEPAATQPSTQTPKEGRSRSEEKHQLLPPVRVLIDLCFQEEVMDEFLTLLSEIIKQGKALPPLYCRKVEYLILEGVFLHGRLHQLLKCLQTPLKYLTINDCMLVDSDLTCLSSCPSTSRLKSLDLSGVFGKNIHYAFLSGLLGRLSATLTNLALDSCGIKDSELMALQPALGHCTQLKSLALCGNPLSINVLLALLHHTVPRCQFAFLELPVPPHCYVGPQDILHEGTLEQVMQDLSLTLPLSRPHAIRFLSSHSRNGSDVIIIDIKP